METLTHIHTQGQSCDGVWNRTTFTGKQLSGWKDAANDSQSLSSLFYYSPAPAFPPSSHYSAVRLADATHCLNGAIRGLRVGECVCVKVLLHVGGSSPGGCNNKA